MWCPTRWNAPSDMRAIKANVNDAMRNLVIKVRFVGLARLTIRLWLGVRFIRLGTWITGANFEIDLGSNGEEPERA